MARKRSKGLNSARYQTEFDTVALRNALQASKRIAKYVAVMYECTNILAYQYSIDRSWCAIFLVTRKLRNAFNDAKFSGNVLVRADKIPAVGLQQCLHLSCVGRRDRLDFSSEFNDKYSIVRDLCLRDNSWNYARSKWWTLLFPSIPVQFSPIPDDHDVLRNLHVYVSRLCSTIYIRYRMDYFEIV